MSSTFKFHSQVSEMVPLQAQYAFPTQSTKIQKQVVKLQPKSGTSYTSSSGGPIRIEFPADGYCNMLNSVLLLDVAISGIDPGASECTFQKGGAHNLIKRLKINYGSLVLEDIQEYGALVRMLTEVGVQGDYQKGTGPILDGMPATQMIDLAAGKDVPAGVNSVGAADTNHYINTTSAATAFADLLNNGYKPWGAVGSDLCRYKRTYALNLLSGLLSCKKLIPLKWMASQLSIEIYLATDADALLRSAGSVAHTYTLSNVGFLAEMVEFDSTYDQAVYAALQAPNGGIPLRFQSWHYHQFNVSGTSQQVQIHERSRSIKSAFAVFRGTDAPAYNIDTTRFFHGLGDTYSSGTFTTVGNNAVDEFQWRVGGRYYPSQPVRASFGGAEALVELLKAINYLGDYTAPSGITYHGWTTQSTAVGAVKTYTAKDPLDAGFGTGHQFIMASEFENTDVAPGTISGINGEEQSDISLSWKTNGIGAAPSAKKLEVFVCYDALLIVRDGNVVDLVM